jgi:hypothetical protein
MLRRSALVVVLAVAGGLAASAGAAGGRFSSLELVVEHLGRSHVLHRERVAPGATFTLDYRHSSEGIPVRGTFRVEGDRTLTVVETASGGFGPGLPELTGDDDWRIAGGMIVHRPRRHTLGDLRLRAMAICRMRLTTPSGQELDLAALAGNRAPVLVRVR